jgi:hypothetical protein
MLNYPMFKTEFSALYACCTILLGVSSCLLGGVLADKYGKKNPDTYANICLWSSILGWPSVLLATLCTNNFYVSMFGVACSMLLGSTYWGPNVTMLQKAIPASEFGNYISGYQFCITMAGCLSTLVMGSLINRMNAGANPILIGRIIAGVLTFGYAGSIWAWSKAKNEFKKFSATN